DPGPGAGGGPYAAPGGRRLRRRGAVAAGRDPERGAEPGAPGQGTPAGHHACLRGGGRPGRGRPLKAGRVPARYRSHPLITGFRRPKTGGRPHSAAGPRRVGWRPPFRRVPWRRYVRSLRLLAVLLAAGLAVGG